MDPIEIGINPIIFSVFGRELRWYGAMMALGVFVLLLWVYIQVRRGAKISTDDLIGGAIVGIISGIVFARLLHVFDGIESIKYYFSNPTKIIGGSGLAVYGAILGAAMGVWIYCRIRKLDYFYAVDVITPGIIMAQAIGRIGCLIAGCCYGEAGSLINIVYTHPLTAGHAGHIVQPVQLYEIVFLLVLLSLILVFRRKMKISGIQFLTYLGTYSLWRFAIGFVRAGPPGMGQAQIIGLIASTICFGGIVYLLVKEKKKRRAIDTASASGHEEGVT